ncbi:MAG: SH3 domain-containing protein [Desulfovibrio sp.]|nr:SH3 domain-containing protein [Desulfovibrio sp.]
MKKPYALFCCFLLLFTLTACAGKSPKTPVVAQANDTRIADERNFPQDLNYFAKKAGTQRVLIDRPQQLEQDRRFNNIFYGPWSMNRATTKKSEICIRKARGYKLGGLRWPQDEWDVIVANADVSGYPSLAQPAITLRNTDLRQIPTHEARYDKAITNAPSYPFDDFQYSLLAVGMPVFITHSSADKAWYFVETPLAAGWVDANDLAPVDSSFVSNWKSHSLAAIIKDKTPLAPGLLANIGAMLPIAEQSTSSLTLYIPVREANGWAGMRTTKLSKKQAQPKPLPITPGNVALLGSEMFGQKYGWGGMYGLRDCSATTHDLLAPFGIWLPRNSRAQARTGVVQSLEGLSKEEKEHIIQQFGTPFLSLIGLPGHITMYVGSYEGQAAILHNVWGVRTVDGANTNARHIIGKTLITSIAPGAELPDLYRPVTFVDRLRSLSTPGVR